MASRLKEISEEIQFRAEAGSLDAARAIAFTARGLAPRLRRVIAYPSFVRVPGWLAGSIEADVDEEGIAFVDVGAFYGVFQEFGTEHQRAHPFLRPAMEADEDTAVRLIAKELGKIE